MANVTWMTHNRGAHGGACCSTYAAGSGLPPSTPAYEVGVACPAPGGCATPYASPISSRGCPVSCTGGPAPGLRHPLRLGGQLSGPAGSVRKADKQHGYSHMARHGKNSRHAVHGARSCASVPAGRDAGGRERPKIPGPHLRGTLTSVQSGTTIRNERRHVMARYALAATIRGRDRVPAGKVMASVSGCYKGPSGLSTSTWPRTSMPTGHPTHAGDGMP